MKKSTKIIINTIVTIVILALLAAGSYFMILKSQENKVLSLIDQTFKAVKTGDMSSIAKEGTLNKKDVEELKNNEAIKGILGELKYEVKEKETKLNNSKIKISVTNKSFKEAFGKMMAKSLELAFSTGFSGEEISDEEMDKKLNEYLITVLKSNEINTVTTEVELNFIKENKEWKLKTEQDKILNAVLPGYNEIKSALESMNTQSEN